LTSVSKIEIEEKLG